MCSLSLDSGPSVKGKGESISCHSVRSSRSVFLELSAELCSVTWSLDALPVSSSESVIRFKKRGSYLGNFWANVRRDPPPPTPPLDEDAITDAEEAGKFKHPLRLPLRIRDVCKMYYQRTEEAK